MSQSTQVDGARRGSRPVLQFLLLMALLCAAVSSAAQCCRPTFEFDEVAAGAGGNAVLRGPWVTSPWRKPLPRLALFTLGSLTYEKFVDHSGWNWSDFNQRMASYLVTEAVVSGATWLRTRLARRHAPLPLPVLAGPLSEACRGDSLRTEKQAAGQCEPPRRW